MNILVSNCRECPLLDNGGHYGMYPRCNVYPKVIWEDIEDVPNDKIYAYCALENGSTISITKETEEADSVKEADILAGVLFVDRKDFPLKANETIKLNGMDLYIVILEGTQITLRPVKPGRDVVPKGTAIRSNDQ